ncbi:UNVERIFIED_CONTAM: Lipase [Sesamum latifolium]|uniref:Lipase n=1 Tax=Sesamum latifolium TaxID=2727402 RepID=A0AAW2X9N7_9LAMI
MNPAIIGRKVIMYIFTLVQTVLQYFEKPLSMFGSGFEMCLNLLGNKSNFSTSLKNLLRGKVVVPSKNSASFLSTIGHLDNRVELDKNIKPGSNKYFATLSAMASKLAYENDELTKVTVEKTWKMEMLGTYSFWDERHQEDTTQAFTFHDRNADSDIIFVAFRGTEPFNADDWITDLDIPWYDLQGVNCRVHGGFMKALGLKLDGTWPNSTTTGEHRHAYNTIAEELKGHFKTNDRTKFILTGHSLGGALAVLFPAVLALHNEIKILERLEGVYTFGQPRVGDERFGEFMKEQFEHYGVRYYRFVYSHDIVPRLPYDDSALMFKHFGTCIYVNSIYEATVVEEEPFKNYFGWGSFVIMRVDAVWELVRSFLLPRMFGQDYRETLLLQMFRTVGLVFPGLPAHGLQDYINATRLATY